MKKSYKKTQKRTNIPKKNTLEIDSEQVLMWAQRVEPQRVLNEMKDIKYFDHIQRSKLPKIAVKQQSREQEKRV